MSDEPLMVSCEACTFQNAAEAVQCEICGCPLQGTVGPTGVSSTNTTAGWTCETCTFAGNAEKARMCEVCGTRRKDLPDSAAVSPAIPARRGEGRGREGWRREEGRGEERAGEERGGEDLSVLLDLSSPLFSVDLTSPPLSAAFSSQQRQNSAHPHAGHWQGVMLKSVLALARRGWRPSVQCQVLRLLLQLCAALRSVADLEPEQIEALANAAFAVLARRPRAAPSASAAVSMASAEGIPTDGNDSETFQLLDTLLLRLGHFLNEEGEAADTLALALLRHGVVFLAAQLTRSSEGVAAFCSAAQPKLRRLGRHAADDAVGKEIVHSKELILLRNAVSDAKCGLNVSLPRHPTVFELVHSDFTTAIADTLSTGATTNDLVSKLIAAYDAESDIRDTWEELVYYSFDRYVEDAADSSGVAAPLECDMNAYSMDALPHLLDWIAGLRDTPPLVNGCHLSADLRDILSSTGARLVRAASFDERASLPHLHDHLINNVRGNVFAVIEALQQHLTFAEKPPTPKPSPTSPPFFMVEAPSTLPLSCPICSSRSWTCNTCTFEAPPTAEECEVCGSSRSNDSYDMDTLIAHVAEAHEGEETTAHCPICGDAITGAPAFGEHLREHHKGSLRNQAKTAELPGRIPKDLLRSLKAASSALASQVAMSPVAHRSSPGPLINSISAPALSTAEAMKDLEERIRSALPARSHASMAPMQEHIQLEHHHPPMPDPAYPLPFHRGAARVSDPLAFLYPQHSCSRQSARRVASRRGNDSMALKVTAFCPPEMLRQKIVTELTATFASPASAADALPIGTPGLIRADSDGLRDSHHLPRPVPFGLGGFPYPPHLFGNAGFAYPQRAMEPLRSYSEELIGQMTLLKDYLGSLKLAGLWLAVLPAEATRAVGFWGPSLSNRSVAETLASCGLLGGKFEIIWGTFTPEAGLTLPAAVDVTVGDAHRTISLQWPASVCEYPVLASRDAGYELHRRSHVDIEASYTLMRLVHLVHTRQNAAVQNFMEDYAALLLSDRWIRSRLTVDCCLPVSMLECRTSLLHLLSSPLTISLLPFERRLELFSNLAFPWKRTGVGHLQVPVPFMAAGLRLDSSSGKQKVVVSRVQLWRSLQALLDLDIARSYAEDSALDQLVGGARSLPTDSNDEVSVQFSHEAGHGLGPTLEFFALASREFASALLGEDQVSPWYDGGRGDIYLHPSPQPRGEPGISIRFFELLGRFIGLAMRDGRLLDLPLSKAFLRQIVRPAAEPKCEHLREFAPEVYASLQHFKDIIQRRDSVMQRYIDTNDTSCLIELRCLAEEVASLGLDLEYLGIAPESTLCHVSPAVQRLKHALPHMDDAAVGSTNMRQLCELLAAVKGDVLESSEVTLLNLEAYTALVSSVLLGAHTAPFASALRRGLQHFAPSCPALLPLLRPSEWQELLCGSGALDEESAWTTPSILAAIQADHGYTAASSQVIALAQVLHGFDRQQRRLFLRFVTGSPRLPTGGLAKLVPPLTVVRRANTSTAGARSDRSTGSNIGNAGNAGTNTAAAESADDMLPTCSTCNVYLKLPAYSSKEILHAKLLLAMTEGQDTFAFD